MNSPNVPRPTSLPAGYGDIWPEEGLPPPLWEPIALRPHHNTIDFNMRAMELGLPPGAEINEDNLLILYEMRVGHMHQAYGTLEAPQNFRLIDGRHLGPVLDIPDFRSVFAQISDAGRVESYVSARTEDDVLTDVQPFANDLEDLMRIIGWDRETVPVPLGYWCPSGANGPALPDTG